MLLLYVDDVLVHVRGRGAGLVKSAEQVLFAVVLEVQWFGRYSRLKVNYRKSYVTVKSNRSWEPQHVGSCG